jgi:hypothetical protein
MSMSNRVTVHFSVAILLAIFMLALSTAFAQPNNPHGRFKSNCELCHTTDGWTPLRKTLRFDHDQTAFPLVGQHAQVRCRACHSDLSFKVPSAQCRQCHVDMHAGQFADDCGTCHTPQRWNNEADMRKRHDLTRFPLFDAHANLDCQSCHANGQYVNLPITCDGCHLPTYIATTNPNHAAGNYSHTCVQCHAQTGWQPAKFDHNLTQFPLTGAHKSANCRQCHANGRYAETARDCYTCHQANFAGTSNPNHAAGQYDHDCTQCHTTGGWGSATFDHDLARFHLTGAHASVTCNQCHASGQYTGTAQDCYSCHQATYNQTTNPNHGAGNYNHDCSQCHTTEGWGSASFDHDLAPFHLTGAHVSVACNQCHIGGQYTGTTQDCYTCHQSTYNQTTNPNHGAGNYNHDCSQCHTTEGWGSANFDHDLAPFHLTGAHVSVACNQCHTNGRYTDTPQDCFACHSNNYEATTNPNHAARNYDHTCTQCHTTAGWQPASLDHNLTQFQLTGTHAAVACAQCHTDGRYTGTPTDCNSCHQTDFANATSPNHAANHFSHTCTQCHNTAAWQPSTFNHSTTSFQLTGAHTSAACGLCHTNGQYSGGLPTDCYACHQNNYAGTTNPNHAAENYDHTCTQCHTTAGWQPASFNHDLARFQLTGLHTTVSCTQCHASGQYTGTPSDCFACHQSNYNATANPSHTAGNYSHTCTQCHTTSGWQLATFDHNLARFPLTGAHVAASCTQCHVNGQYAGTPTDCYVCHQSNFNGAGHPNHIANQFGHACTECHNTTAWQPSTFSHSTTAFPLSGGHVTVACGLCHTNGQYRGGLPTDCYTCHLVDYNGTTNPNHAAGNYDHSCTQCHTTNGWQPATFNHDLARFHLNGAHSTATCTQCHANGQYTGTPTECFACHQSTYDATTNPNHTANQFGHSCAQCHNTASWQPSTFDHNATTFQLTGAHNAVACGLCHTNGQYSGGVPTDCYGCHQYTYSGTTNPNHVAGNYSHTCTQCHTTAAWQPATFDHSLAQFQLTGAHASVSCTQCHANSQYTGTPTDCYTCHQTSFENAASPNHATNQFDYTCTQCHNTAAWQPSTFSHSTTSFALTGAHTTVVCVQCHTNGQYSGGLPTNCYTCHQTNYNGTTNPNHSARNYGHTCTQCHTTNGWSPATFDHNLAPFRLTGAHATVACNQCHANEQYTGTPTECFACHAANYNETTNPNHAAGNYNHTCTECHTTSGWTPASFDHNLARFQLSGAHAIVACTQCHANGQFTGTPQDCYTCHQANFESTTNPNHVANQFAHTCTQCHNTSTWQPSTFDHGTAAFQLTGAHTSVSCGQCHINGQYSGGLPTACYDCHLANFNGTTNPNHVAGNFNHACTQCHTTDGWRPANYNHNLSQFPLTGAHTLVSCTQCHVNGQYSGTSSDCYSCHQTNFTGTTNPNHVVRQYSHTCTQCHTTAGWQPATFDHNLAAFPLTGAHTSASCNQCHGNGQYTGTPSDCYACHQANYSTATSPNHAINQFSHTCTQCHTTNAWQPSTFDHSSTIFQLTGVHTSVSCGQCHTNGQYGGGLPTDCYGCHQTDFSNTTNPNHAVGNYNHTCTQCHTTAGWQPASFDHNLARFQLTGAHTTVACTQCHANSQYTGTAMDCYACHQSNFTGTTDPNHAANQFSHICTQCHNTAAWQPSTFNHSATTFALAGAHTNVACGQCHTNGHYSGGLPTDCYGCHQTNYNGATSPNHAVNQFSHACTQCHNNTAWQPSTFNHSATSFALAGAHTSVACGQCHTNGQYSGGLPTDCYGCHQSNYGSTTSPNHAVNQFSHTCTQCHNMNGWQPATFDHSATMFQLTGAHTTVACGQCHTNGQYSGGLPTECYSCHQASYMGAVDPNHVAGNYNHTCTQCHTSAGWQPATFDHRLAQFQLTGAHASVSCAQCHTNGHYNGTPMDCYTCHQSDYGGATSPNHANNQFSHTCAQCHTTTAWQPSTFNHNATTFALTGAHTSTACGQCHTNGRYSGGLPTDCYACHQSAFGGTTNPNHVAGNYNHTCTQCHTTAGWQPASFDHNLARFTLTGAHTTAACNQCHANGQYAGTPMDCYTCHQSNFTGATVPNHALNQFNHTCAQCHNTAAWQPSTFNHNATPFALAGAHTSVACSQCHTNGQYNGGLPTDCYGCHQANYNSATNPNHSTNQFGHTCTQCHNVTAWQPSTFNHSATTFQLTGAHASVNCGQCHTNGQYSGGLPTECYGCHQSDYNGTTNPNHAAGQYGHDCTQCHTNTAWQPATFDHNLTPFPLNGAHTTVTCSQCHANGQYTGTPTDCYACHQTNFNGTTNPNHVTNQFVHTCTQCHNTTGWQPSTFNHNTTTFQLTGAHNSVACGLCHTNGRYSGGLATDCYGCHQPNFNGATSPNHATNQFGHTCTQCHNTTVWQPSTFNHATTAFSLTGTHVSTSCILCHLNGNYSGGVPTDCYACHQSNYQSATSPNHATNQFNHGCTQCHTTTVWQPSTFSHGTTTFSLTGAHTTVACISCHVNGNYSGGVPTDCYACHLGDYGGTTNPNHTAGNYSHTCTQCHTTTAWQPATINHNLTPFPLTGAHTTVACSQCHVNGQYTGTPTDCFACHQTNFNGAASPNHVTNQFAHTCTQCHNTTAWQPSTFNHATTAFPLTGAHASVNCIQCHANGQYLNTPTVCSFCHLTDYNASTNPNHTSAGFPTTCQTCHTTQGWTPSTFNHDGLYFPIYSGSHRGRWSQCSQCHTSASNFAMFTCTSSGCHSQSSTNSHHQGVSGYVYDSAHCYSCHPRGRAGLTFPTSPPNMREQK